MFVLVSMIYLYMYFNSQPHKEADLSCFCNYNNIDYFNSQPHKEADWDSDLLKQSLDISTHSLTRRLTTSTLIRLCYIFYFNSQPHKEAD